MKRKRKTKEPIRDLLNQELSEFREKAIKTLSGMKLCKNCNSEYKEKIGYCPYCLTGYKKD